MAIIYSYTQETNPQPSDLLFGTDVGSPDKATKSFSIQSIVNLVQDLVPGGGTVTSINTNATNYITMSGGPITSSGTLTASLSATGTASANTFLRGDNVWSTPPAAANTTYTLTGAQSGFNSNIRLTGSDGSQTILSLIAGPNIQLTNNGSSNITIGVTGLPEGTVTSVTAGGGLYISAGLATVNPVLAVDLTGLNNYIKIGQSQTTAISDDFIAFNQSSSTNVKTTTLGAITPTALSLVKSYIDAGDLGDVKNNTDTFTDTGAVEQIVSLSGPEYAALATKNANTLYVVVAAASQYMTTLAFTNNINGTEFTIEGDQAGLEKIGIAGASYAYNSTVKANDGFYFSTPASITNASGLFTADQTVYTILSGTISDVAQPTITATLAVSTAGVQGTQFTLGGNQTGYSVSGPAPLDITGLFNTTITASTGYVFTSPPVISNATGTINGSQTVVTTISGVIEQASQNTVTVTANIAENFTGAYASQASATPSIAAFSGNNSVVYDFTVTPVVNTGYYFVNPPVITGDLIGSSNTTRTADIFVSAQVEQIQTEAIVNLVINNQIGGVAKNTGYTITTTPTNTQQIGSVEPNGFNWAWEVDVELLPNYVWAGGIAPSVFGNTGTAIVAGEQNAPVTIDGATCVAAVSDVIANLQITYNVTSPSPTAWTPTGWSSGSNQTGAPGFTYNFNNPPGTPSIEAVSGYVVTGLTITGDPLSASISTNTQVDITLTATVEALGNCKEFFTSVSGVATSSTACGSMDWSARRRHNGANADPEIGDIIYTTGTCTTPFNGLALWYTVLADTSVIRIQNDGSVTAKEIC